jgi:kynurenine formamidase
MTLMDKAELDRFLAEENNWGRWGADDQIGTLNLITADKRREAAGLVRTGRTVSLSHAIRTEPAPDNPIPAQHYVTVTYGDEVNDMLDFYGLFYHGLATTHIDALCHIWDENGLYNGADSRQVIDTHGSRWGSVEGFRDGVVTRGVLLDVPRYRGVASVVPGEPVTPDELEAIAAAQGVEVRPGDALVVYAGRDAWDAANGAWGTNRTDDGERVTPGLDPSCLRFLKDHDVAVLAWDMMEVRPRRLGDRYTVHAAIHALGLPLVDNCDLAPLAEACAAEQRWEFMLSIAPLVVVGGSGSPVNPLALF